MTDKILKFAAPWCEPCKAMAQILEEMDLGGVEVEEINVDAHKELAAKWRVRGVPTLIYLKDGTTPVKVLVGSKTKSEVQSWLNQ